MDIKSFSQDVRTLAKADDKKANGPMGREVSSLAHDKNAEKVQESAAVTAKKQLNASILQSAIDVNLTAGDNPQALLLKTALEGINDALEGTLGPNAIQNAYDSGLDVSPEATAERIVSLSTAFFSKYQDARPELSEDEARTAFAEVISGGINKGFAEAREILTSLDVLNGEVADNIDKTYDLVQEGLKAFSDISNQDEA